MLKILKRRLKGNLLKMMNQNFADRLHRRFGEELASYRERKGKLGEYFFAIAGEADERIKFLAGTIEDFIRMIKEAGKTEVIIGERI